MFTIKSEFKGVASHLRYGCSPNLPLTKISSSSKNEVPKIQGFFSVGHSEVPNKRGGRGQNKRGAPQVRVLMRPKQINVLKKSSENPRN